MWVPGQFSSVSLDYMLCSICLSEMIHSRVQNRVIFGVCGLPWIIIISSRNEKKGEFDDVLVVIDVGFG